MFYKYLKKDTCAGTFGNYCLDGMLHANGLLDVQMLKAMPSIY
jgi:hypothetical protein